MADEKLSYDMHPDDLLFWKDDGKEYMLLVDANDFTDDPRKDADPLTKLYCQSNRHNLGDYPPRTPVHKFLSELVETAVPKEKIEARSGMPADDFLQEVLDGDAGMKKIMSVLDGYAVLEPVWVYEHSGMTISVGERAYPFTDKFDAGQFGWIAATKKDIERNWPDEDDWKAKASQAIRDDVHVYDQWLQGDVYWCQLFERPVPGPGQEDDGVYSDTDWTELDSCGGFYGTDIVANGIADYASHGILEALREGRTGTGTRRARQVMVHEYHRD